LARFNLAVARMRLNDTDEAIAEFRQVIRQQPNHGMAYFLLGTCYDQQAGKVGEALACHEKACQLMGNPPKDLLTGLADLL
jgi:Flp pilus assembly protein TadD